MAEVVNTTIPKWMIWTATSVGGVLIALIVTGIWQLLGGGLDDYVDGRANERIAASQLLDDGTTLASAISGLTTAVTTLTVTAEAKEATDREFREDTRNRLESINRAMRELLKPRE